MILELSKAVSFFLCILSLCGAAMHAFFVPGASWEERFAIAGVRLALAAYVCVMSGLVFTLPVRSNPERGKPLASSLPVRLFLWCSAGIVGLLLMSWFLGDMVQQASPFVSDRTLERF